MKTKKKRNVINFNHVSNDISDEDKKKLMDMHRFYHRQAVCYKWKYKNLKKLILLLNMLGIGLTCIGAIVGAITLNPFVIGTLTGLGVVIKGYIAKSNALKNVEKCKYAYTNYKKILVKLRNTLRGAPLDESAFLAELKIIDDIVTDTCPDIDGFTERYEKTFEV